MNSDAIRSDRPARLRGWIQPAFGAVLVLAAGPPAAADHPVCTFNVAGSCYVPHSLPGCSETDCCNAVCMVDAFCCDLVWDAICAGEALSLCAGSCSPGCEPPKLNLECLNPGSEYNNRTFVGRLVINCNAAEGMICTNDYGDAWDGGAATCCTGWIAGSPDFIVTNNHCIFTNASYAIEFNDECDKCSEGVLKPVTVVPLVVMFKSKDLDVAILRTPDGTDLASTWGRAKVDPSTLELDQSIYEIHHSNCQPKGYDDGRIDGLHLPHQEGCPGTIAEHLVSIVSSPGASGSPVFRNDNDCVAAICHCGPPGHCPIGKVLPCDLVWPTLKFRIESAGGTVDECAEAPCPYSEHNCFTGGSPGCSDVLCCITVCDVDDFCCDTAWDGLCVDAASKLCDGCGDPASGDCCEGHAGPFCDNRACCNAVCAIDPFCCEVTWDDVCASEAELFAVCGCVDCAPDAGSCFVPHDTPGCADVECCSLVCEIDPFCCVVAWDGRCKDLANFLCGECGDPRSGCCYAAHAGAGCNDAGCCRAVCEVDPFCCDTLWDEPCALAALASCCIGDLDGNGLVDGADLGLLLAGWGGAGPTDLDCDGTTGADDLGLLLANWGPCRRG